MGIKVKLHFLGKMMFHTVPTTHHQRLKDQPGLQIWSSTTPFLSLISLQS